MSMSETTKQTYACPWNPTPEDFEKHDMYADYVAWERWMDERMNHESATDAVSEAWMLLDTLDRVSFYTAMHECCEVAAKGAVPTPPEPGAR